MDVHIATVLNELSAAIILTVNGTICYCSMAVAKLGIVNLVKGLYIYVD